MTNQRLLSRLPVLAHQPCFLHGVHAGRYLVQADDLHPESLSSLEDLAVINPIKVDDQLTAKAKQESR